MPKLPKDLQKKRKSKMQRVKKQSARSGAANSRAMRRKLQQQGIESMDTIEATRVIIETPEKNIVIENPQVIALSQQGMTVHQVIGEPVEHDLDEDLGISTPTSEAEIEVATDEEVIEELGTPEINEQDIILVSSQANVSQEEARKALEDAKGDLAKAILALKTK